MPRITRSRRGHRRRRASGSNTSNGDGARSLDGTRPALMVPDAAAAAALTGANPLAAAGAGSATGGRITVGSGVGSATGGRTSVGDASA